MKLNCSVVLPVIRHAIAFSLVDFNSMSCNLFVSVLVENIWSTYLGYLSIHMRGYSGKARIVQNQNCPVTSDQWPVSSVQRPGQFSSFQPPETVSLVFKSWVFTFLIGTISSGAWKHRQLIWRSVQYCAQRKGGRKLVLFCLLSFIYLLPNFSRLARNLSGFVSFSAQPSRTHLIHNACAFVAV